MMEGLNKSDESKPVFKRELFADNEGNLEFDSYPENIEPLSKEELNKDIQTFLTAEALQFLKDVTNTTKEEAYILSQKQDSQDSIANGVIEYAQVLGIENNNPGNELLEKASTHVEMMKKNEIIKADLLYKKVIALRRKRKLLELISEDYMIIDRIDAYVNTLSFPVSLTDGQIVRKNDLLSLEHMYEELVQDLVKELELINLETKDTSASIGEVDQVIRLLMQEHGKSDKEFSRLQKVMKNRDY